jgi:hypothetical protein
MYLSSNPDVNLSIITSLPLIDCKNVCMINKAMYFIYQYNNILQNKFNNNHNYVKKLLETTT